MTEIALDPRYLDFYRQDVFRPEEAKRHLGYLLGNFYATGILEFGSGNGSVTSALRMLYPSASLTIADNDPRALNSARQQGVFAEEKDIFTINSEYIDGRKGIDLIVGLRLPGRAILHLLTVLRDSNFKGIFVSSLWELPYESDARKLLLEHVDSHKISRIILNEEPYQPIESGYIVHFE